MSTHRGSWILNRIGPDGWPIDLLLINPLIAVIQKCFPSLVNWFMERDMNKKFDHELYNLKPSHRLLRKSLIEFFLIRLWVLIICSEQHPSINDDFPNRILCGSVIIKPNVKQFTSDDYGVIFEDGTQVDHIDSVLMATGFNIAFPYLNENILSVKDNKVNRINETQTL